MNIDNCLTRFGNGHKTIHIGVAELACPAVMSNQGEDASGQHPSITADDT